VLDDKALRQLSHGSHPAGTYKWQESGEESVAVKAVLDNCLARPASSAGIFAQSGQNYPREQGLVGYHGHTELREANLDEKCAERGRIMNVLRGNA